MTCHCNRPTIIPVAFHQAWPASLGPQTISRMPKAWVEAPLLPVESTCISEVSRTQQTDSWNYWKISQTSSKTPHYSTINDHQSKSISSTYDTTSDMMQNHWLLWYCCASTNSSWTSKIFSAKPFLYLFFQSDIPGFSPPSVSDSVSPLPKQRAVRRCTCLDESLDESEGDFSWWLPKMMDRIVDYWMV